MSTTLFDPVQLGRMQLANRIAMAPMTRSRATDDDLPTDLHATYYSQRASAGLIVTEGVQPSKNGKGYCRTPGIYNAQQVQAWRAVTDAVHQRGGHIALQIMHCGRIASRVNQDPAAEIVAPSAIAARGKIFTEQGMKPFDEPRALDIQEIPGVIEEHRQATANAYEAGFDAVELHCASGYLPAQFLSTGTNHREDRYGGSLENRLRFVLELLAAMNSVDGADRVGIRICPGNPFNDLSDDDPQETFAALLQAITPLELAYLHLIRLPAGAIDNLALVRDNYRGKLIVNDGYDFDSGQQAVAEGQADMVSFGRNYISNPDLVERYRRGASLADMNLSTLYTPGPEGYIDYPALDT
ncbi:MAG: alkene reductase [Halioglobus sp.]|nr:alkene reductase [Halioglobus sp.]